MARLFFHIYDPSLGWSLKENEGTPAVRGLLLQKHLISGLGIEAMGRCAETMVMRGKGQSNKCLRKCKSNFIAMHANHRMG